MNSRRAFLKLLPLLAVPAFAGRAPGQAVVKPFPKVKETDPAAAALGYRHDTTKVDPVKFPKHQPGEICSDCILYKGKPGGEWGPCTALPGRQVKAKGWCRIYNKKP